MAQMKGLWILFSVVLLGCSEGGPAGSSAQETSAPVSDRPVSDPFPTASEVRLFVNTDYDKSGRPVFSKPDGRLLSPSERAEFESLLSIHTIGPDELFTACFIPHHFFRYFDKAGKLVGEIQVCFCCAGVQQSGASSIKLTEGQMLDADYTKLKAIVRSLGERTDVQCEGEA